MKAMVLAAGLGTRLRPLTNLIAKPALPIGPKSLIEWVLLQLRSQGVTEVVVNLHHRPETVRKRLGDGSALGLRLHYSEEPEILGTAGGLAKAAKHFSGEETFLMVNADSLWSFDLADAIAWHRDNEAIATMVLLPPRDGYSTVETRDRRVSRIGGRPSTEAPGAPHHFTGIHVLSSRLLDALPAGFSEINRDIYPDLIEEGELVGGFAVSGDWFEFGDPASYLRNTPLYLASKGIRLESPAEDDSQVVDSVVWDGARVTGGARVERCIVTTGAVVQGGVHRDLIITPEWRGSVP